MRTLAGYCRFFVLALCGAALVALAGCASVQVTDQQSYLGPKLARPDQIIVHDFAATPEDLPAWSDAARTHSAPAEPVSEQELATGRQLGARVAEEIVKRIDAMGLTAVQADGQTEPRVGDIVIVGYFVSIDAGSAAERVALGFGEGAAQLTAKVEGYETTSEGMRKLGSGTASSKAGKSPGVLVPLAVTVATANPIGLIVGSAVKVGGEVSGKDTIEGVATKVADAIADQLQEKFSEQGWIE